MNIHDFMTTVALLCLIFGVATVSIGADAVKDLSDAFFRGWEYGRREKKTAIMALFCALVTTTCIALISSFHHGNFYPSAVKSDLDGSMRVEREAFFIFPWENETAIQDWGNVNVRLERTFVLGGKDLRVEAKLDTAVNDEERYLTHLLWWSESGRGQESIERLLEREVNQFVLEHLDYVEKCSDMTDYCNKNLGLKDELVAHVEPLLEAFGLRALDKNDPYGDSTKVSVREASLWDKP